MNCLLILFCTCLNLSFNQCPQTDSLELLKESVIESHYMIFPFDNDERITWDNISMAEQKKISCHSYVFENNTEDYAFLWFSQDGFNLYMYRPLFPLSIMSIIYEYGSTLTIDDPSAAFITPFLDFYKIVKPKETFHIYIYAEDNDFSEEVISKSIQYIRRSDTFLVNDNHTFSQMQEFGYKKDAILLSMKSFIRQPLWIEGRGLRLVLTDCSRLNDSNQ